MSTFLVHFLHPFTLLMFTLVAVTGWVCRAAGVTRRRKWALALAVFGLYAWTMPVTARFSTGLLEGRFPRVRELPPETDVIVLLGGGVIAPPDPTLPSLPGGDTLVRCAYAADLLHRHPGCSVIVSGGKLSPDAPGDSVGEVMRRTLVSMGIDPDRISLENTSRDTFENARDSAAIIRDRGWTRVVVASTATHLPRAMTLFRSHGITDATAAGCSYYADDFRWSPYAFFPKNDAGQRNQQAFHELLGYVKLKLRGRL